MTITLITGANKGIGYQTARQLIALGHTVYLGARDVERGQRAAAELGGRFVQLDVTDDDSVSSAIKIIDRAEGRLDVLINNAGIAPSAPFAGDILTVLDTNVAGVLRVTEAALELLHRSADPVVVNVSSSLGSFWAVHNSDRQESRVLSGSYGASKAAVTMLTVQYARKEPSIRFNAVEPGYTDTDLTADVPGGRSAEDSAAVVVRMATVGAGGPTGTLQEEAGLLAW
ncbi:SDR family NAD(P)-dependent oxidoreductase [Microlunatus soli]|uniref:NADP-dependent 3-hydroxy acid dehydrogenase YdfG n=1 Tax=Microlunatus soli TaxID=630515 RepID=A0A1H1XN29_9ACTN|nr:SDR family NAD(P)-dependent oxidoreductase [Microlunatus soli]SDT10593.1 NADP-dependent 3-hydroxy acid dehydrogenase YdfG [Microlunatus soli]